MFVFFFFFQAEDGIRDKLVTGVQTCALPISLRDRPLPRPARRPARDARLGPRGRAARGRRPADRSLRRLPRRAAARLALPRAARSGGEGRRRAPAGLFGDELRAGPPLPRPARLPRAARPLVLGARQRPLPPHAPLPPARSPRRRARPAAAAAGTAARRRSALRDPRPARPLRPRRHLRLL